MGVDRVIRLRDVYSMEMGNSWLSSQEDGTSRLIGRRGNETLREFGALTNFQRVRSLPLSPSLVRG